MNTPSPSPYFQSAGPTIGHGDISQTHNGHGEIVHSGPEFIAAVIIVIVCLASACFASGLTQGLLSLDAMEMEIKARSGTDKEKKQCAALIPIISRHHLLLCTLMLWNASAMEVLPLYLNRLVPEFIAIILSVTLILIVGEIIPASIMTGPKQLDIVSTLVPLVWFVIGVFFVLAYPLSIILDFVLGHDEGITTFNRRELTTMVQIQQEETVRQGESIEEGVNMEEVNMIGGVLKFRDLHVKDVMTTEIFMLSVGCILDVHTVGQIFSSGYSRIPIYDKDRDDIIGVILTKDMLFIDPDDSLPMRSFFEIFSRPVHPFWTDDKLYEVLRVFRDTRGHMGIVREVRYPERGDPCYVVVGIVTLEDIIEEILGSEILDETDALEGEKHTHDRHRNLESMKLLLKTHSAAAVAKAALASKKSGDDADSHPNAFGDDPSDAVDRARRNSM